MHIDGHTNRNEIAHVRTSPLTAGVVTLSVFTFSIGMHGACHNYGVPDLIVYLESQFQSN